MLVVYHIQLKNSLGSLFLFVRMDFAKKMDDHVVYFFNLTIFDKIQFKP